MTATEPTILTISGDLTAETASGLLETIRETCRAKGPNLVLHLQDAHEVDPHGLGALIRGLKLAEDAGGTLAIGKASPELGRMMELTGLDRIVPIHAAG